MTDQGVRKQPPILSQSRDYSKLLDVIDLLRSQGVSRYVSLPQLIVCGDQSSGKSSVLEAVSGVRFPTKDSLCTRFATELILRKEDDVKVKVEIIPGKDRDQGEREALSSFKVPDARLEDFPSLVEAAKEAMGLNSNQKAFSSDVLRVEVTGPDQTNVTLVDLPGLIHAENKQQSAEDISLIASLVRKYIAESRSIILTVISAKNDLANQIVTKLARDVDPQGTRTLGIITKPDKLNIGSESERDFVELAKNEDVVFRLGWHVLKNRDYTNRDCSAEERDDDERSFFSRGIWTTLPANILGVDTLKLRLSTVLHDLIISELPSLICDVEKGIEDCMSRLAKLGHARSTSGEQRRYLLQVGQAFGSLVKAAVGGAYTDDFFGRAVSKEGQSKRLRAMVQSLLIDFADEMQRNGHEREIIDNVSDELNGDKSHPPKVARDEYVLEVRTLMRRSRGCELPGTFNPLIVGDLFFQQAQPWKAIVHRYCQKVLEATKLSIDLCLMHLADDLTRSGLDREVVGPALERISRNLEDKVSELMKPHQKGHPITYNDYFTETVQQAREDHEKKQFERRLNKFFRLRPDAGSAQLSNQSFNTGDLLRILTKNTEQDMELYACSEATDCMEAYYKVSLPTVRDNGEKETLQKDSGANMTEGLQVAMKTLVDNFAVLGIEFCLLEKLSGLLSSDVVMSLDDSVVQEIAAEKEGSKIERARASSKLQTLQTALYTLRLSRRHRQEDFNSIPEFNGEEIRNEKSDVNFYEGSTVQRLANSGDAIDLPQEPAEIVEPLSPFDSSGSPRADKSWLNRRSSEIKKKKMVDF